MTGLFPLNGYTAIAYFLPAVDFCGCTDCLFINNVIYYLQEQCIKSHALFALIGMTANRSMFLGHTKRDSNKQIKAVRRGKQHCINKVIWKHLIFKRRKAISVHSMLNPLRLLVGTVNNMNI